MVDLFSSTLFTRAVDQFAELAKTGDCAGCVGLLVQRGSNGITRRPVLAATRVAMLGAHLANRHGAELLADHHDVLSVGRHRSRPNAVTCDLLQPPVGEFTDRRLSGEAFCQCAVSLVLGRFGDVAVTRGNGERTGLAGGAADSAVGLSPRGNPDLASPVEERLGPTVGRLVDDVEDWPAASGIHLPRGVFGTAQPPPGPNAPKATTGVHRSRLTFSLLNRLVVDLRGRPQTYWRKAWDSNPRRPERPQQFSRLSHSSALAAFRRSRLAVIGRPGYEQVVPSSGATSDSKNSWTIPRTQSSPR